MRTTGGYTERFLTTVGAMKVGHGSGYLPISFSKRDCL